MSKFNPTSKYKSRLVPHTIYIYLLPHTKSHPLWSWNNKEQRNKAQHDDVMVPIIVDYIVIVTKCQCAACTYTRVFTPHHNNSTLSHPSQSKTNRLYFG